MEPLSAVSELFTSAFAACPTLLDKLPLVSDVVDSLETLLEEISVAVWIKPELAYEEHLAHDVLTSFLTEEGFKVQRSYYLPTAFRAEFATPDFDPKLHPTICFLSEYDALPDIGHACGHNLIAVSGLASATAVKRLLQSDSFKSVSPARVVCLGTPAEETTGGKIDLLKTCCFDDISFALMAHGAGHNVAMPIILGLLECEVEFFGDEKKDTCCKQHIDESFTKDAADAAVSLYAALTAHRSHLKGGQQIHGVIYHADEHYSKSHYYLRTPTVEEMAAHKQNFMKAVEGASSSSGCRFSYAFATTPFEGLRSNCAMASTYEFYAKQLGMDFPANLPPSYGSTDMGNVSNRIPAIHPFFRVHSASDNIPPNNSQPALLIHTVDFQKIAGTKAAFKCALLASKALAMTALELIVNKDLARAASAEFRRYSAALSG